ncbi:MAG: hypothetical protein LUO89_09740 [Methanothrix sp.]|nr:hypothetical protein [Methanothrix sp.]
MQEINSQHILSYRSYLRADYVPLRIAGDNSHKLTPKTIYNIYVSLALFFTWASREFTRALPRDFRCVFLGPLKTISPSAASTIRLSPTP